MQALFLILGEEGKEDVMRNIYILFIRWACGTAIQLGEPLWIEENMKWWFGEAALPSEEM